NFDALTQADCDALIQKKLEKEANRFIRQWPEEKIAIENGRWGPFIRFGKKMLKLYSKPNKEKYTSEELAEIDLDVVKGMITEQDPTAFTKKATKKAAPKKTATKKSAAKKSPAKKAAAKKSAG
ncbi:MAG: DNA topoisomerase I, partial [Chitinophagaceae bacterium]